MDFDWQKTLWIQNYILIQQWNLIGRSILDPELHCDSLGYGLQSHDGCAWEVDALGIMTFDNPPTQPLGFGLQKP